MLVNKSYSIDNTLSDSQLARIAAHAATRHPNQLLLYLSDPDKATKFIDIARTTRPIRMQENTVCPMDTPYLIEDQTLRDQLGQIDSAHPSELRRLITPFLQCFYPGNWEVLEQAVRTLTDEQLPDVISTPGALHQFFLTGDFVCPFSPPRWVSLSHTVWDREPPAHWEDEYEEEDEEDADTTDCIHPITELGYTEDEFHALTPEQQRRVVLAKLPTALIEILPQDTIRFVMKELREMATQSIAGALDPLLFHKLIGTAPTRTTTELPSSTTPLTYTYRFRLQHGGKGAPAWTGTSPGEILRRWLLGWVPMFLKSDFTLTLVRQPSDKTPDPIIIMSTLEIPEADALEHYTFDVKMNRTKLIQFDFWFITECADINNNGAQSFARTPALRTINTREVRDSHIWSMKMERLHNGLIPCIMLERSLIRDRDEDIKAELSARACFDTMDAPCFEIEWITIGTTSKSAQIMIKCVLAAPSDHPRVINLWTKNKTLSDQQYPTTSEYRLLILPHPRTPAFDQELNQAIARHCSYLQALTHTVLVRLPPTNPNEITPAATLMSGMPPGPNRFTMTYLLRHGLLELQDGTTLASPVVRVNTDQKGTRLYLYGAKSNADKLLPSLVKSPT